HPLHTPIYTVTVPHPSRPTRHLHHPHLHSFPTRRSSDLPRLPVDVGRDAAAGGRGLDVFPERACRAGEADARVCDLGDGAVVLGDRKSTRLNSSHVAISYAVFCLKKKMMRYAECVE